MHKYFFSLLLVLLSSNLLEAADSIRSSVVQLHFTRRNPDFYKPWTKVEPVGRLGKRCGYRGKSNSDQRSCGAIR